MCFSNYGRNLSVRASLALVALLPVLASAAGIPEKPRGGDIEQVWFRITQQLDQNNTDALKDRIDEMLLLATQFDIKRFTPHALALTARSDSLPAKQAETVLAAALRLDPGCPETLLSLASLRFRNYQIGAALTTTWQAFDALVHDSRLLHVTWPSLVMALLIGAVLCFSLWALLALRYAIPRLWHDLTEFGSQLKMGSNAVVLAVFLLALPLFAGGDPVWLILWIVALSWAYLTPGRWFLGIVGLLLIAVCPTVYELAYRKLTHPPNPLIEAAHALADRRYAPQLTEELAALQDLFAEEPAYHLLIGDCYRQYGYLEAAALSYREGLRLAPKDGALSMASGCVSYLEGDFNAALQAFQVARDAGYDPLITKYNLSYAMARTYHFREGESELAAARQMDPKRLHELTRGRDHQPIFPILSLAEVTKLAERKNPILLLNRGLLPPPLLTERSILHPLAIAAVFALVLAVLHFLVRTKTSGLASACLKCGRSFCRYCKLSTESQSYCTQCINIFMKKDMVPIEAQMAKRRQLGRRHFWLQTERRLADLVLPGLGLSFSGRPVLGIVLAIISGVCAAVTMFWLPWIISPVLLNRPIWPLQLPWAFVWLVTVVIAQLLPTERR